jgi:hypothetical protein
VPIPAAEKARSRLPVSHVPLIGYDPNPVGEPKYWDYKQLRHSGKLLPILRTTLPGTFGAVFAPGLTAFSGSYAPAGPLAYGSDVATGEPGVAVNQQVRRKRHTAVLHLLAGRLESLLGVVDGILNVGALPS